jgi:hypothetical protein
METENTPVVEDVVDVVESTPEVSHEPEVRREGLDATEAVYDQLAAKNEAKASEDPVEEAKVEEAVSEETEKPDVGEQKADSAAKGLDPTGRGPNSWKAPVREKFKSLPPDVQSEVLRRENEHQKLMTETTSIRKFSEEFTKAYGPYEAMLKGAGVQPIAAFEDLLKTVYTLKTADSATKGQIIAQIIKSNNVDLGALDAALVGSQEQIDPQTAALQQELNQLKQWRQQEEQQRAQQLHQTVDQQIQTFASDPSNEFFHDVVSDMQILLNSGRAESLKDAYEMACRLNPDVYGVIQNRATQRSTPVQAAPQTASVQQKVAASSGVKGAPAANRPAPAKKQLSGADAALAAWEQLERKIRT